MSKIKMRCISCGKWFQSANAKEVTCPDCAQKARKEKLAAKNSSSTNPQGISDSIPASQARPPAPSKPKSTAQGGTNQWLDKLEDVKVAEPDQPLSRPKFTPSPVQRDNRSGTGGHNSYPSGPGQSRDLNAFHGPAAYRVGDDTRPSPTIGQRPRQPLERSSDRGPGKPWQKDRAQSGTRPKPKAKVPRPPAPPKPKREKIPPPPPFTPTPEQITQVEERYLELCIPTEFDGIRTQIAHELEIPKKAVKKIIKDLRSRQSIPSWWEIQTYKGSSEELETIKAAYTPYLPLPPVGVHKKIAEELSLKAGIIYQAIKMIRQEMKLPQYNDPDLHGSALPQHPVSAVEAEPVSSSSSEEDAVTPPNSLADDPVSAGSIADTSSTPDA